MTAPQTYSLQSEKGKQVLAHIKDLSKGSKLMSDFIPALPMKAIWTVTEMRKEDGDKPKVLIQFLGAFCGIPFYNMDLTIEGSSVSMQIREVE